MKCCKLGYPGRVVKGQGNKEAKLVYVGEGPGLLDINSVVGGEPFIGESGGLLNWFNRKSGIVPVTENRYTDAFYTNALKCYPAIGPNTKEKANISTEMIKRCRKWLKQELDHIKPDIVVALGAVAAQSVLGRWNDPIKNSRGFWWWSEEFNCHVMPTPHPSFVLRNWGATSGVLKDFEKVKYALDNGVPEYKMGEYRALRKVPEIGQLFKRLWEVGSFTVDLETSSLEFWTPGEEILGVSICYKIGKAYYIPLVGCGRTKIWTDQQLKFILSGLKKLLESAKIKKAGQNIKFDVNWFKTVDIHVTGIVWDTMQVHHLIDENTEANLTYLTSYYNIGFPRYEDDIQQYKTKRPITKKITFENIPDDVMAEYACADVDAGLRIETIQRTLMDDRQHKLFNNLSIPLSKLTAGIERDGALIDVDRIDELEVEYEKKIQESGKILAKMVGSDTFNVGSSKQVIELLYDKMKLPVLAKTKKGGPSTDGTTVKKLVNKFSKKKKVVKVLELIKKLRSMRTLKSTNLVGYRKIVDWLNRVHSTYLTTGTVTGRLSSRNPNNQNIPRDQLFRSLFIAGEDEDFLSIDYSQIEDRILAFLAGETKLIEKYQDKGFDPHTYTSAQVRQKDEADVTSEERSYDKAVKFGMNYGRSNKSISEEYDLPMDWVNEFVTGYFEVYDNIRQFRDRNVRIAKKQGYLQNPLGRRRNFTAFEWCYSDEIRDVHLLRIEADERSYTIQSIIGNMERQALNFPMQSYAWDLMTQAAEKLRKKLKERKLLNDRTMPQLGPQSQAYFVLTVHDMIGIVNKKKVTKITKFLVNKYMPFEKTTKAGVTMPFYIDMGVDRCWKQ